MTMTIKTHLLLNHSLDIFWTLTNLLLWT